MKTLFRIEPVGVPLAADYDASTMVLVEGEARTRFLNRIAYQSGDVEVGMTIEGFEAFGLSGPANDLWKRGAEDVWSILEGMPEPSTEALTGLFATETAARGLPKEGDALEMLQDDVSGEDRKWLSAFVMVWELVQGREDAK